MHPWVDFLAPVRLIAANAVRMGDTIKSRRRDGSPGAEQALELKLRSVAAVERAALPTRVIEKQDLSRVKLSGE
jgi:hypothetical protein